MACFIENKQSSYLPWPEDKQRPSGICSTCREGFQDLDRKVVYHPKWNQFLHPVHLDCIKDYFVSINQSNHRCPECRDPIDSRNLFNRWDRLKILTYSYLESAKQTCKLVAFGSVHAIGIVLLMQNFPYKMIPGDISDNAYQAMCSSMPKAIALFLAFIQFQHDEIRWPVVKYLVGTEIGLLIIKQNSIIEATAAWVGMIAGNVLSKIVFPRNLIALSLNGGITAAVLTYRFLNSIAESEGVSLSSLPI